MLRITIEILPFGFEKNKRHLGTATIANDGTGTLKTGNYTYKLSKWGRPDAVWRRGHITGFPRGGRGSLGPWDLLFRVLKDAVGRRSILK